MKLVNCFYIFSSVFAVVCAGHIPDEKLLDEEALSELGFPHLSHPYIFSLSSVGEPTFESDFDLSPPPLPPLEVVRESRTRLRQRPSNTNGDRGSARRNENANANRNNNNNNSNNNRNNNNRNNNNRNNNRDNNRSNSRNPTDTNELSNSDEDLMALLFRDDNNGKREVFLRKQQRLEDIRNFYNVGEIRKKREADPVAEAEPTAGRFRGKRGYCKKCGGGGLGGGALPVYQVPVYGGGGYGGGYRPSYGGGCNSCGGGYPGFGGGHGGGGGYPGFGGGHGGGYPGFGGGGGGLSGSYSQSSSHASSSSGGWGYGRK